jgi:hypothetical protein
MPADNLVLFPSFSSFLFPPRLRAQQTRGEYDVAYMSLRRLPFWRRWRLGCQPPRFGGLRRGMPAVAARAQDVSAPLASQGQGLVQVAYSDPASNLFLGSPSIARLADSTLLISHVSQLAGWPLLPLPLAAFASVLPAGQASENTKSVCLACLTCALQVHLGRCRRSSPGIQRCGPPRMAAPAGSSAHWFQTCTGVLCWSTEASHLLSLLAYRDGLRSLPARPPALRPACLPARPPACLKFGLPLAMLVPLLQALSTCWA